MNKKVTILGAGFSGLTLAYYLNKLGVEVQIYEKKETVGGLIQAKKTPFGFYETAANGLMGQKHVYNFLEEAGISYRRSSDKAKKRFIFRRSSKHRWPLSLSETLRLIVQVLRKMIINRKNKIPQKQETVLDWGQRNLTPEGVKFLLQPALQGIYASHIKSLSAKLILGSLFRENKSNHAASEKEISRSKNNKKGGLLSGENGTQDLLFQLSENLKKNGVMIKLSVNQEETLDCIQEAHYKNEKIVIATSAQDALALLSNEYLRQKYKDEYDFLNQIKTIPIVTVTVFVKEKPQDQHIGFGCLFPEGEGVRALGVLMNGVIYSRESSYHSETWIFGGEVDPEFLNLSDADIKDVIKDSRQKVFQSTHDVLDICITRYQKALPHYTLEHEKNLNEYFKKQEAAKSHDLYLHGNYMGVIGLSKILQRSQDLAKQIKNEIDREQTHNKEIL